MSLLSVKNLSHAYGAKKILADISLDIHQAELLLLSGINGSGKTTLIKLLAKVISLQNGELTSSSVSLHLPSGSFYPEISLRENLYFFCKIYRANLELFEDLAEKFELKNYWDQTIDQLSLGQKLRGDLVRTFIKPAKVYLLDEPFNGLDISSQKLLIDYLTLIIKNNQSVILTTHNKEILAGIDYKEYHLADGKIKFLS